MLGLAFIYFAGFVMFMALIGHELAKVALVFAIATAWAFYQLLISVKQSKSDLKPL